MPNDRRILSHSPAAPEQPTSCTENWRPDLAEALFGDIVRSAREKLELPDDTITQTLRDAVHRGIPDDDEEALEEFLRRTLPPSVSQ